MPLGGRHRLHGVRTLNSVDDSGARHGPSHKRGRASAETTERFVDRSVVVSVY